jgi:hypothetical protein
MSDSKLQEALDWWYSADCSKLPTVVDAADYVRRRWGQGTLEAMQRKFVGSLRQCFDPQPEAAK